VLLGPLTVVGSFDYPPVQLSYVFTEIAATFFTFSFVPSQVCRSCGKPLWLPATLSHEPFPSSLSVYSALCPSRQQLRPSSALLINNFFCPHLLSMQRCLRQQLPLVFLLLCTFLALAYCSSSSLYPTYAPPALRLPVHLTSFSSYYYTEIYFDGQPVRVVIDTTSARTFILDQSTCPRTVPLHSCMNTSGVGACPLDQHSQYLASIALLSFA
jgi:hypothetical protein